MGSETYIAIDLKSFYASVECVERGLDPLNTNLVVADTERTEKTICLAVSPSLKAYGIPGRARLFEVIQKVREVNALRRIKAPGRTFSGSSCLASELTADPSLQLEYIAAIPQMAHYMEVSASIYQIYLKYIAPEDIHVYSIDEVFINAGPYLKLYGMNAHDFTMKLIHEVLSTTGITATAGIGTNLYLCKIAMDITAKHIPPDKDGVRIAELDEISYRKKLWEHQPITDFWRIGHGYQQRLASVGLYTMGDIARCSLGRKQDYYNEDLLYKLFGINAELLIDHAWGWEPARMEDIKSYRSRENSISSGQVLKCPYDAEAGKLIVREMTDLLILDLVEKGLVTDQMVLTVCYDHTNFKDEDSLRAYSGAVRTDHYGKKVPKEAHGSINLGKMTSSTRLITDAVMQLYDRIVDPRLLVRRMYVVANHVVDERSEKLKKLYTQIDLFTDYEAEKTRQEAEDAYMRKEKKTQNAVLEIRRKFGKNAVLKGMNLLEGGTTIERNGQIGGHRA